MLVAGIVTLARSSAAPHPLQAAAAPRGAQLFREKGLQIEAWVMGSELFGGGGSAADREIGRSNFFDSDFTPTFYNPPYWSPGLMDDPRASSWSTASDRKYNAAPPSSNATVLTPDQAPRAASLRSICFGDEEQWNATRLLPAWGAWAALAHAQVPGAIVHTNQWLGEFSFADYVALLAAVPVDMVVIDNYDFPGGMPAGAEPRNTSTVGLLQACATVRDTSLAAPAAGSPPLPFGYYVQGYETHTGYQLSSAQIRAGYFLPLALGAKWLNMFRWAAPWIGTDSADGQRTAAYYTFQRANRASRALSPLLSQLQTAPDPLGMQWVGGRHVDPGNGSTVANPQPTFYGSKHQWPGPPQPVPAFAPGRAIANVTARNLGQSNRGLPEDVLVTRFVMLPRASIPGINSTADGGGAAASPYSFVSVFNGLAPNVPDEMHSSGPALGEMEIMMALMPAVQRLREWSTELGGGWIDIPLAPIGATGGGPRQVRVAMEGGSARFFCATLE